MGRQECPGGNMWLLKDVLWQLCIRESNPSESTLCATYWKVPLSPWGVPERSCHTWNENAFLWATTSYEEIAFYLKIGSGWATRIQGFLNFALKQSHYQSCTSLKASNPITLLEKVNVLYLISFWCIQNLVALLMLTTPALSFLLQLSCTKLKYMLFVYILLGDKVAMVNLFWS